MRSDPVLYIYHVKARNALKRDNFINLVLQKKVYVVIIRFYVLFDKINAFSFIQLINQIEEDGLNNAA